MLEESDRTQAATQALRHHVELAVGELFDSFIDELGTALDGPAGKNLDERTRSELTRLARVKKKDWTATFVAYIDQRLLGNTPAGDIADATHSAQSAQTIATAKALLLAETRYFKLITELDARLNRLRLMLAVPIYASGLAPVSLFQALTVTAKGISWPTRHDRPLFEAFDGRFICRLQPVYELLLAEIKRITTQAAQTAKPRPAPPPPPTARPKPAAERMQPPADQHQVDPQTAAMLNRFAVDSDGEGYTDGLLAADLLALMDHRPLPGISEEQLNINLQRMSLAGHYLNEVTVDPLVPADLRPEHESLRLPLVKSALVDASVFTADSHPLRSMIDELMLRSATLRLADDPESRRVTELLQEVLSQFDLAPDFVRDAMATSEPLEDSQVQRFFELQRQQAEQRKQFVINEAKRMVAEELERCSFGRDLPPHGKQFIDKAWSTLLTKRLLQHGASHDSWSDGLEQADLLVDMLESRDPEAPPSDAWKRLCTGLCDDLVEAGLPKEQRGKLLAMLEAARRTR